MEMLNKTKWNSLVVQWVGPYMSTAGDMGLILWSSTKIHMLCSAAKKKWWGGFSHESHSTTSPQE